MKRLYLQTSKTTQWRGRDKEIQMLVIYPPSLKTPRPPSRPSAPSGTCYSRTLNHSLVHRFPSRREPRYAGSNADHFTMTRREKGKNGRSHGIL